MATWWNEKLLHIRHYQKLIPLFQRPPWHIHMSFALKLHTYSNRWQNERLFAQSFKLKQQNNDMLQVRSLMAEISSWSHRLLKNCYNFGLMKRLISLVRSPPWIFIYTLLNYKLKIIIGDKCKTFQDKLNSKQQKNDMDGRRIKKNCYNFGLIKDLFPLIGVRYKIYVFSLKRDY